MRLSSTSSGPQCGSSVFLYDPGTPYEFFNCEETPVCIFIRSLSFDTDYFSDDSIYKDN